MKTILTLVSMRIRITLRNKAFLFFSLIMPMAFFFLYGSVFAKGNPIDVRYLLGPVVSMSVMGTFWGLSAQLVTWREQGILRRFRLSPVSAFSMIGSSILANMVLILPTVILEMGMARGIYHVTDFGNLTSVFVLSLAGIGSFASLGLIVASVTNTMQETQIINQLLWFALIFVSGATVPLPDLPKVAQHAALFLPATYLVTGLQRAMVDRANVFTLWAELGCLLVWGALAVFISSHLFRWEPEAKLPRNAKLWAASTVLPFILLGIWENHNGRLLARSNAMMNDRPSESAPLKDSPIHRE
ncbi:MAG TPA: ABC transporter permease [Candidatus Eisenbacteria bacterium]|nr:ABC transporter permease [Candidatus Eisenbacteria bacterium]